MKQNIRVKYDDLKAYMMDGGTLFFCCVILKKRQVKPFQIYYADLLPIRIMKILEQTQELIHRFSE